MTIGTVAETRTPRDGMHTRQGSQVADWRDHYRGALIDARGNEIPITEQMIRSALIEADPLSRPPHPAPNR